MSFNRCNPDLRKAVDHTIHYRHFAYHSRLIACIRFVVKIMRVADISSHRIINQIVSCAINTKLYLYPYFL